MPSTVEGQKLELVEQVKTLSLKVDHIKSSLYQGIHKEYTDFYPSTQVSDVFDVVFAVQQC